MTEQELARKFSVRAHGRILVLRKHGTEKREHRIMMALLWALYLPAFPELRIDVPIGRRYRPDLVQLDAQGEPFFWGESGAVGAEKLAHLCRRYRTTHLVFAKWATRLDPVAEQITRALTDVHRSAPVELIGFPADAERHIAPTGTIAITFADVERYTWHER